MSQYFELDNVEMLVPLTCLGGPEGGFCFLDSNLI